MYTSDSVQCVCCVCLQCTWVSCGGKCINMVRMSVMRLVGYMQYNCILRRCVYLWYCIAQRVFGCVWGYAFVKSQLVCVCVVLWFCVQIMCVWCVCAWCVYICVLCVWFEVYIHMHICTLCMYIRFFEASPKKIGNYSPEFYKLNSVSIFFCCIGIFLAPHILVPPWELWRIY
jgi:hypothetical protein